ncbi:MAG: TetR family transcriptional regulator [Clostridia bacterium]|nr:TetR family transcriptional regulator [Clostridia bacterium]
MPSFTKKAIVESFLRLAGKKALEKITVRDIVDDCGINRNTFYYYFQDIYAVLEELCHHLMGRLPTDKSLAETVETYFRLIAEFNANHPKAVRGLLASLGHGGLERYFAADFDRMITDCLLRGKRSEPLPDGLTAHLTVFIRHAVFGYCFDYLRCDRPEALDTAVSDLIAILGHIEEMTSCSEKSGKI